MSLYINGTFYDTKTINCPVVMNGTTMTKIVANGTTVFEKYSGPPSPVYVRSSKTLVAGTDFPAGTVRVLIVGAGGSGSRSKYGGKDDGGGYAGSCYDTTSYHTSGTSVKITVGAGGSASGKGIDGDVQGNDGGGSSFGDKSVSGGSGGTYNSSNYAGNGGTRTVCGVDYKDGTCCTTDGNAYGGQAGRLGDGGAGVNIQDNDESGKPGGLSAGGGSATSSNKDYNQTSGAGGNGLVVIRW